MKLHSRETKTMNQSLKSRHEKMLRIEYFSYPTYYFMQMYPLSRKFFALFLFVPFAGLCQKPNVVFEEVLLQKDVVAAGAKGFKISGKCNFLSYKQNYASDSLMNRAF